MLLYIALILVGVLLMAAGVLGVLGRRLPAEHSATGSVELGASQESVFALVNNIGEFPAWCKEFTRMERLPDQDGRERWRQFMGRNSFTSTNEVVDPPRRVVRVVEDDNKMFSGSWDHVVEATGPGSCRLTIKETGRVHSDIPRAIMHYVVGEDYTIRKFLAAVKAKVG